MEIHMAPPKKKHIYRNSFGVRRIWSLLFIPHWLALITFDSLTDQTALMSEGRVKEWSFDFDPPGRDCETGGPVRHSLGYSLKGGLPNLSDGGGGR